MAFIEKLQTSYRENGAEDLLFKFVDSAKLYKWGFFDDEISNARYLGGTYKAVYASSLESYKRLQEADTSLPLGCLHEKMIISGMDETNVCIGDIHQIGEAFLQVSQPGGVGEMAQSSLTGWYYRVLKKGDVKPGDEIKVIGIDPLKISIREVKAAFYAPSENEAICKRILKSTTIAPDFLEKCNKKFTK